MVFLQHPLLGPTERLDLRSVLDADGPYLILEYPGGTRSVRRFDDDVALSRGTARLHDQLRRDGWDPPGPQAAS